MSQRWVVVEIASAFLPLLAAGCHKPAPDRPALAEPAAEIAAEPAAWSGVGAPPAQWSVEAEPSAPAGFGVLRLDDPGHSSGSAFNLCLNDGERFRDGSFTIHMRADAGEVDQGGGPVWRVQDASNYYICRANPLEGNFRLYVVKDGKRRQLASIDVEHASGSWHSIAVTHEGDLITCVLDGESKITATDSTFLGEGGVGVWSKADARTSFVVPESWRGVAVTTGAVPLRDSL